MNTSKTRTLTPARLIALILIALLALGLVYIRFGPHDGPVSVPAGAKAGDLILKPGSYETEEGRYAADIGTLVVPENRAHPGSRLIALPVVRIRAKSAHPAEPIFRLEGGPGVTNMEFDKASGFADNHDVVLVGYRGVDGSVRLDAPEVTEALKHSDDLLSERTTRAVYDGYRAAAKRLRAEGVDLGSYGLAQQVDDLEAARVALGYGRVDLLSESAGTRTAMIYSWRYPKSIHRSVMIAVNPPGNFLWYPKTTDEQIARYAALYSQSVAPRGGGPDLAASIRYTNAHMPDHWLFLPIKKGNVRVMSFFSLMESSPAAAPASGPMAIDSWLAAARGDASGLWFASLAGDLLAPTMFVRGQYAAAGRLDAQAGRAYFAAYDQERDSDLGVAATAFGWVGGKLTDAWPAAPDESEYSRVRTSNVETLLIGGELDFTTPPQIATKELLPYLPNGQQIVLPRIGHTVSFWSEQPEASTRLINAFLDSGEVDDSLYKAQSIDFTPRFTHTALAKIALGTMVGLAVIAALSLLWMARRAHKRVAFGVKTSAALRSLYPLALGLGAWFLGALVVMATLPAVPLDNVLLATLSIGIAIGLGLYWAWVHGDSSGTTKTAGFVGALSGALIGAWLGFNVLTGLTGIFTAILGATLGANLILILLDISLDQPSRSRPVAAGSGAEPLPAPVSRTVLSDGANPVAGV